LGRRTQILCKLGNIYRPKGKQEHYCGGLEHYEMFFLESLHEESLVKDQGAGTICVEYLKLRASHSPQEITRAIYTITEAPGREFGPTNKR